MKDAVAERTREIGIRMALRAEALHVLGLVARQALIVISLGLVLGIVAALALTG